MKSTRMAGAALDDLLGELAAVAARASPRRSAAGRSGPGARDASSTAASALLRREHLIAACLQDVRTSARTRSSSSTSSTVSDAGRRACGRHFGALAALDGRDLRQTDAERRATARLAVDLDRAAALLHDAVHRCQSETGPVPCALGREERLEDVRRASRRPCRCRCR